MIKAVIFDFDGLIIDSEVAWYEAYRETLAGYGARLSLAEFAGCVGTGDDVLHAVFRDLIGDAASFEEIEAQAARRVEDRMKEPVAREGVKEYLTEAKAGGYRIALATSSSRAWAAGFLESLGLIHYFDAIVTKDDVEHIKPSPELYLLAAQRLGAAPSEAVAFEDSVNGCNAAVAAGIPCVIVPSAVTADLLFEGYAIRLNSLAERPLREIIALIEEQTAQRRT